MAIQRRQPTTAAPLWLLSLAFVVAGCDMATGPVEPEPPVEFDFDLPTGFPAPRVPAENPMTVEKVDLGRHLFYDERLSGNGTMSCGSCHEQDKAFTDAKPVAEGSTGQFHILGSM